MSTVDKKNVVISIRGFQCDGEGDMSAVEMVTNGHMSTDASGALELQYEENFPEGTDVVLTTLLMEGTRLTLLRSGGVNTQMVFEKGRRHISYFNTQDGPLTVGVTASKLALEMTDGGGRIEMVYGVEVDHALAEENHISIDIRETTLPPLPRPSAGIYYDKYVN